MTKEELLKEYPMVEYELAADEPAFWNHEVEDGQQRWAVIMNDQHQLIDLVEVPMTATQEEIADVLLQKYINLV